MISRCLVLACALLTSCVDRRPSDAHPEHDGEPSVSGEPTAEAQEPLPVVRFSPRDFPFLTVLPDDGGDEAGGWQTARAKLEFWHVAIPRFPRRWECAMVIGMPLRTKLMGRISPSRAAALSVEIGEATARAMDYKLPNGIFCHKFIAEMSALFKGRYPFLGAAVMK